MYLYLLAAFAFGVVSSVIAFEKGRNSLGWFFAGLIAGPLALLVVLLPRIPHKGRRLVRCAECAEVIPEGATVCRYCKQPQRA